MGTTFCTCCNIFREMDEVEDHNSLLVLEDDFKILGVLSALKISPPKPRVSKHGSSVCQIEPPDVQHLARERPFWDTITARYDDGIVRERLREAGRHREGKPQGRPEPQQIIRGKTSSMGI